MDRDWSTTISHGTYYISEGKIDFVINIPKNYEEEELTNDYLIRRRAIDFAVPLITNVQVAKLFIKALSKYSKKGLEIKEWSEYH